MARRRWAQKGHSRGKSSRALRLGNLAVPFDRSLEIKVGSDKVEPQSCKINQALIHI